MWSRLRPARIAALVGVLAGAIGIAAAAPNPKSGEGGGGFQTSAPTAILIDAESGTVLFEKNADELMPPASMSKLMTAEVVFNEIKQGKLKLDDEFIVSENAWRKGGAPSHGVEHVRADQQPGARSTTCCTASIIQSGNDACIALAEGIAGSEAAFADMMTKRAREIGLTKSNFTNSTGLPDPGT